MPEMLNETVSPGPALGSSLSDAVAQAEALPASGKRARRPIRKPNATLIRIELSFPTPGRPGSTIPNRRAISPLPDLPHLHLLLVRVRGRAGVRRIDVRHVDECALRLHLPAERAASIRSGAGERLEGRAFRFRTLERH